MSLLSDAMVDCVIVNRIVVDDGYGGVYTEWHEGARFKAAIVFDSSIEARTAEAQGVKSLYTITTQKGITLQYHDVIKRIEDGKILRITSDGDDKFTPRSSGLNMRQVTAEEYNLG